MIKKLFTYGPFAFFLLTMLAGIVPLKLKIRAQALAAMVLLLAFAKFACYAALCGDAFVPALPEKAIWAWNALYSSAVILMALALLWLPFLLWWRPSVRTRRIVFAALCLVAAGTALRGLWNGVKPPEVHEVELRYADLPPSLEGYRILHVTDIHVSSAARRARTEEVVRRANAAGADLIVVTGDIVDGDPAGSRRDVEPLKDLAARDGVYFTTGNHEFFFNWLDWVPFYDRWGIRFLRNECVFPHPGLALGGVDDENVGRVSPRAYVSVLKTFAAATNGEFRVLLRHRPVRFEESVRLYGVRLQLSGHTHGGVMPILDRLVAKYNGGRCRGLTRVGDSILSISRGAGQWAGFPLRFFNDPELPLYVLRRGR